MNINIHQTQSVYYVFKGNKGRIDAYSRYIPPLDIITATESQHPHEDQYN